MTLGYWVDFIIFLLLGLALISISRGKLIDLTSMGLETGSGPMRWFKYIGIALIMFQMFELIMLISS